MARQDFWRDKPLGLAIRTLLGAAALLLTSCAAAAGGGASVDSGAGGAHSVTSAPSASATSQGTSQGSTGERPTLTCMVAAAAQGIDTVALTLSCQVTGAPSDDTSFTLDYTVSGSTGSPHHFSPACSGALSNGHGVCLQRYYAPVTQAIGKGVVAGMTKPDQRPLGPVTPQQTPAPPPSQTPIGGPRPTFAP